MSGLMLAVGGVVAAGGFVVVVVVVVFYLLKCRSVTVSYRGLTIKGKR